MTTHTTKLGLRYAIDTSPEPISNGVMSVGELGLIATIVTMIWHHPYLTLGAALAVLIAVMLIVRLIWRTLRQVFSGRLGSISWLPSGRTYERSPRTPRRGRIAESPSSIRPHISNNVIISSLLLMSAVTRQRRKVDAAGL